MPMNIFYRFLISFTLIAVGSFRIFAQPTQSPVNTARDSIRYTKLKTAMSKSKVGRELYGFLFQDVYNQGNSQEVSQIEQNPFAEHQGKVIRKIYLKKLKVFGESIYDTTKKASNWTDKALNKLHKDTQEQVIKNSFLLFEEGDVINAQLIWDNERLLRSTSIFHDARILVLPDATFPNQVDVLVLTQDVWSLEPLIDAGGVDNFMLGLAQRNVRGLGHSWSNSFFYNKNQSPKWEFQSKYIIPYIKKTYIVSEANLAYFRDFKQLSIKASRQFITPNTKWAGSGELSRNQTKNYVYYQNTDSVISFPLNYNFAQMWVGRAFKLKLGSAELQERSRLILAFKTDTYHFTNRPQVTQDTNRLYSNRSDYLCSIGFTNRKYKRDLLIYGYGRTEDVPIGYLASATFGFENTEFGRRPYLGFKLAQGSYLKNNKGYLYNLISIGGYRRNSTIEQGIVSIESNYFSPLLKWRRSSIRHFATLRYTEGINRFDYEYVSISNDGIRGLNSSLLRGTQKLTLGLETVCFSPISLVGFRMAFYGFADLGIIKSSGNNTINNKLYQGYGLGVRLRNENLTFNTVSIRIGFYPSIPNASSMLGTDIGGEQVLRLKDFTISEPQVIPFR